MNEEAFKAELSELHERLGFTLGSGPIKLLAPVTIG